VSLQPSSAPPVWAHVPRAHLLPKLRCHFAEFLKEGSLKRLGIFSPPTCVGLRYGHNGCALYRSFSWKPGITEFMSSKSSPLHLSAFATAVCGTRPPSSPPTGLNRPFHQAGSATLLRPSCRNIP